jgi:hypothetical protein
LRHIPAARGIGRQLGVLVQRFLIARLRYNHSLWEQRCWSRETASKSSSLACSPIARAPQRCVPINCGCGCRACHCGLQLDDDRSDGEKRKCSK